MGPVIFLEDVRLGFGPDEEYVLAELVRGNLLLERRAQRSLADDAIFHVGVAPAQLGDRGDGVLVALVFHQAPDGKKPERLAGREGSLAKRDLVQIDANGQFDDFILGTADGRGAVGGEGRIDGKGLAVAEQEAVAGGKGFCQADVDVVAVEGAQDGSGDGADHSQLDGGQAARREMGVNGVVIRAVAPDQGHAAKQQASGQGGAAEAKDVERSQGDGGSSGKGLGEERRAAGKASGQGRRGGFAVGAAIERAVLLNDGMLLIPVSRPLGIDVHLVAPVDQADDLGEDEGFADGGKAAEKKGDAHFWFKLSFSTSSSIPDIST